MFYCLNCHKESEKLKKMVETHGLDEPPYEKIFVCPYCGSENIIVKVACSNCGETITDDFIVVDDNPYCDKCYARHNFDELYFDKLYFGG